MILHLDPPKSLPSDSNDALFSYDSDNEHIHSISFLTHPFRYRSCFLQDLDDIV